FVNGQIDLGEAQFIDLAQSLFQWIFAEAECRTGDKHVSPPSVLDASHQYGPSAQSCPPTTRAHAGTFRRGAGDNIFDCGTQEENRTISARNGGQRERIASGSDSRMPDH